MKRNLFYFCTILSIASGTVPNGLHALNRPSKIIDDYFNSYQIGEKECQEISYNHQGHFAKPMDQGVTPFCWAHVTAGLLEEQLCKTNAKLCGEQVSRMEVAAKAYPDKYLLNTPGGGHIATALENYLGKERVKEVCMESYAPYIYPTFATNFELREFKKSCEKLENIPLLTDLRQCYLSRGENLKEVHQKILEYYTLDDQILMDEDEMSYILKHSKNYAEFIHRALLFNCSKGGSVKLTYPNHKIPKVIEKEFVSRVKHFIYKKNRKSISTLKQIKYFKELKKSGNSAAVSICYLPLAKVLLREKLGEERYKERESEIAKKHKGCGRHALIFKAISWNKIKNRCEVFVGNSHGESKALLKNSWYGLDFLLRYSYRMTYLK